MECEFREYTKKYGTYLVKDCRICENKKTSEYYYKNKKKGRGILNLIDEVWYDVVGYEGYYFVSNKLRIKSSKRYVNAINDHSQRLKEEKLICVHVNKQTGYPAISLTGAKGSTNKTMHTIIAERFIPNPDNLPEVNHLNGNKLDYRIENLGWVTESENILYNYEVLGYKYPTGENNKLSKEIIIIHPNGVREKIKGVTAAARKLGSPYTAVVSNVLRGKTKSYKGYKFEYIKSV